MKKIISTFALLLLTCNALADFIPGENDIFYDSEGYQLAGHLYLPADFDAAKKYPLIVFTRPATGIKEQTAGLYAEKLSNHGFVTIAYDPQGYGESEGRRLNENPFSIIQDTQNTVTYATTLDFIDHNNIFAAGICMGTGYSAYATAVDERIKGLAMISPYLTMHIDYPESLGGDRNLRLLLNVLNVARRITDKTGLDFFLFAVPTNDFLASLPSQTEVANGMRDYYLEGMPGDHPNWVNKGNLYDAENLVLNYNPFDILEFYHDKPVYYAYGEGGYSTDLLQTFYDEMDVPEADKQLRVVDGTHFEIYWKPEYVEPIVEDVAAFFKRYID